MSDKDRIRQLNDEFRQHPTNNNKNRVVITAGVHALGHEASVKALLKVMSFDDFNEANDPHQEHDLGTFELEGEKIMWKFDYYDNDLEQGSEDPANPDVTVRVLTIMLASEY